MDPYRVLGVSRSANEKQIRRAYLALAKKHHPDRGGDAARFDQITKAWNQLYELESGPETAPPRSPHPHRGGEAAGFDHTTTAWTQLSQLDPGPDPASSTSRPRNTKRPPKPKATADSVRYRPPLADGPVRTQTNPPVSVDSLLAQQV